MILKVLFIQRHESYEGQYAPEALCCIDEFSYEENPNWIHTQVEEELNMLGNDVRSNKIIDIEVDPYEIRKILLNNPVITGKIAGEENHYESRGIKL